MLSLLRETVELAGYTHDLGKLIHQFQNDLREPTPKKRQGRVLHHEYASYQIIMQALAAAYSSVSITSDHDWLRFFSEPENLKRCLDQASDLTPDMALEWLDYHDAHPFPILVGWLYLVLTHHRLPDHNQNTRDQEPILSHQSYVSLQREALMEHYQLDSKIQPVWYSQPWLEAVSECCQRLLAALDECLITPERHRIWLPWISQTGRALMVVADHQVSAEKTADSEPSDTRGYANTVITDSGNALGQRLDHHLIQVGMRTRRFTQYIKSVPKDQCPELMPEDWPERLLSTTDSTSRFYWQQHAVELIQGVNPQGGFFGLLLAKTGAGKTVAYTRILGAFGPLRFSLALGLRSLALQSGDAYRDQIGFNNADVATIIGSSLAQTLHEHAGASERPEPVQAENGRTLLAGSDLVNLSETAQRFLHTPITISTVDYLVPCVDARQSLRQALHLRLMTSDLILDEIDAYNPKDLLTLARLVYLSGRYGRRVILSSATLPPAIAQAFMTAYWHGYREHCVMMQRPFMLHAGWFSHLHTHSRVIALNEQDAPAEFMQQHNNLMQNVIRAMDQEVVKHRISVLPVNHLITRPDVPLTLTSTTLPTLMAPVFHQISQQADQHHRLWATPDPVSGAPVSCGVINLTSVKPVRAFTRYAMNRQAESTDRVGRFYLCYHAKHPLLTRHLIERFLDEAMKGHDDPDSRALFQHPVIRAHIDNNRDRYDSFQFIVVTTTIEEVGRDHDFDWCIMDPRATRSVIQMAGRVRRHRQPHNERLPNVTLLDTTLRELMNRLAHYRLPAFSFPGIESPNGIEEYRTHTCDTRTAFAPNPWFKRLDARRMLCETHAEEAPITALEHRFYHRILHPEQPHTPLGELFDDPMTGLHNRLLNSFPFRGEPEAQFYLFHDPVGHAFYRRYLDGASREVRYAECTQQLILRESDPATDYALLSLDYLESLLDTPLLIHLPEKERAEQLLGCELRWLDNPRKQFKISFHPLLGFIEELIPII